MRAFAAMGAAPQAAIPSRMADGYGLNPGMVEELHTAGASPRHCRQRCGSP